MGKLYFSARKGVDEAFKLHCDLTGTAYAIVNFLSWLQDPNNQIGRETIKRILEED